MPTLPTFLVKLLTDTRSSPFQSHETKPKLYLGPFCFFTARSTLYMMISNASLLLPSYFISSKLRIEAWEFHPTNLLPRMQILSPSHIQGALAIIGGWPRERGFVVRQNRGWGNDGKYQTERDEGVIRTSIGIVKNCSYFLAASILASNACRAKTPSSSFSSFSSFFFASLTDALWGFVSR